MKIKIQKINFTLIEIIAAMAVFLIIMLILISFFVSAQSIWNLTRQKNSMYENARVALDLIGRDLQCLYYEQEKIPFFHHPGSSAIDNDTEALYFVSATNCLPCYDNNAKLCEIAYKFYNLDVPATPSTNPPIANAGWLVRSVTGDQQGINTSWNFYSKPTEKVLTETPPLGKIYHDTDATYAFTKESYSATGTKYSRDVFNTVIPYVVDLSFICYKKDGTVIGTGTPPSLATQNFHPLQNTSPTTQAEKQMIPYSIMIQLTLLDRESWLKWKSAGSSLANPILLNNARSFSRTVLIGERGQKY